MTAPLAYSTLLADTDITSYISVMILITMAVVFGIFNVIASLVIGPRRDGATKSAAYESGMDAVGTARKRFNVRFYMIAMVFLVFDIEIIFLYPWAVHFDAMGVFGLVEMVLFIATVFVAYAYVWRRGGLDWD